MLLAVRIQVRPKYWSSFSVTADQQCPVSFVKYTRAKYCCSDFSASLNIHDDTRQSLSTWGNRFQVRRSSRFRSGRRKEGWIEETSTACTVSNLIYKRFMEKDVLRTC